MKREPPVRFDVHAHVFPPAMLGDGVERFVSALRLRDAIERLSIPAFRGSSSPISGALRSGLSPDGEAVLAELSRAAGAEPVACCPLMLDTDYMTDTGLPGTQGNGATSRMANALAALRDELAARRSGRAGSSVADSSPGGAPLASFADGALDSISRLLEEAEEGLRVERRPRDARVPGGGAFDAQLATLSGLKRRHPDLVYPFLGLDPRRDSALDGRLLEFVLDSVGPGKTFAGVKLYPSLGFSPTDPFLFGKDGFYEAAERLDIPITVHFSAAGFGTLADRVAIRGDVYDPDSGSVVPAPSAWPDGTVEFRESLANPREAVSERIRLLDHPALWAKVLAAYPRLVLNLAHAGGYGRLHAWLDSRAAGHWTAFALDAMERHPRVYADLSGWYRSDTDESLAHGLDTLAARLAPRPRLARKLLYGSDWVILSLKEPDLGRYFDAFRAAFGSAWDAISRDNPRAFLGASIA